MNLEPGPGQILIGHAADKVGAGKLILAMAAASTLACMVAGGAPRQGLDGCWALLSLSAALPEGAIRLAAISRVVSACLTFRVLLPAILRSSLG